MSKAGQSDRPTQFEAQRRLVEGVRSESRRCANEGTSLAILAIGLDRFDAIVAAAGEEAAEDIFAKLLRAVEVHCGRERDRVSRIASDRIVAVCPKTLPAGARHIASQIREAADQLPPRGDSAPVTLSIGISTAAPADEDAAGELLERAERSLEAARANGGNRIIGAVPATQLPSPNSFRALLESMIPKKQFASARRQGD